MRRRTILAFALVVAALVPARVDVAAAAVAPRCDTGGSPTTTVYLPNITKTLGGPTGWVTPFIVQNVGFFPTTLEVSFYRFSDGTLVDCRKVPQLQPGRSFADVPNNDAALPDGTQFAVVVRSFGSEVVAVVNEHNGVGERAEALAYDGITTGATRVALPYVAKNASGWLSTIVVQNVGASFTSVSAAFRSLDGQKTATVGRTIAPGRSAFIDPRQEPDLVDGVEYSAIVTSSAPVGVVVNSHNDAATVARPRAFAYNGVVPTSAPTFLPLVARNSAGIGRTSRLIVQNTSATSAATPTLDAVRFGGGRTLMTGPLIAAGRAWSFDVRQRPDGTACPAGGGGCIGEGEYGVAIGGGQFATLDILLSDATSIAVAAQPYARSRMFLPNVTRTLGGPTGWTTPIIVQPPVGGPTSVSLRWYRFSDGRFVTQQVVTLVPGAGNRIDPRAVSALADNTQYAVIADATGPFAAIVEEAATGGANAMIYPGFASEIWPTPVPAVIAVTGQSVTTTLGSTLQLSATVTDQFGSSASKAAWPLTWSLSPASLGTTSSSGLFTALGYGSGKIVASAGAVSTAIGVTVQSPPGAPTVSVPVGASVQTVATSRGIFTAYVVKEPLSEVSVRTLTMNASDCIADCPAQPLVEYLNQTASFAGMNGTYFCPPDYAACAGELNAYGYAVYSSTLGYWLNEWALVSPTNSLVTVRGRTLRFYEHTYDFDRGPVDAAISNFPLLLRGGAVVDSEAIQTDYQKQRGYKGSIGTDGTYVFLVLVPGASVTDSAYVVQALGETDAMNLDGGGSSALFGDGAYRVGPGRQLPNAVVIARP